MPDDGGSWAPFGPDDDDPQAPSESPDAPVSEPPPEQAPPAPVTEPEPAPEPEDLPPAAVFQPPVAQPQPELPASPLSWPTTPDPVPPPPPAQPMPPVGSWPPPGPPGFQTPARVPSNATASLVLGIVGLVVCPLIASIAAIALGNSAKREIRDNPGLGGKSMASWGVGLGWVGVAFGVFVILVAVIGALNSTQ
jgi:hypothetical protein